LFIAYAVALPDVPVHSLVLAPDAPPEIVIDRHGMANVAAALDRVLAYHHGAREKRRLPGPEGAAMLRDLLAPTITIKVPMAQQFRTEDEALVELTREQSMLLQRLARNPRMAIYGCAGSGKTMLAVEHAKRLAADGLHVLYVCFNKALAAHLASTERHDRIEFTHFHRLCARLARKASIELPEYPRDETPQEFFLDELPDALTSAIDILGEQFDALIVDEAQDLHDHWLTALRYTLRNEETAPVWLFLDDNQRVYDVQFTVPSDFFAWELSENCRNTQAIHRELLKLYEGKIRPTVRGPEGRPPELSHTEDQPATVAAFLDRLTGPDDVPPGDVVVLSSHGWDNSDVAARLARRLVKERSKKGDGVLFSSIRGFKGLESPVVVLCELEDLDEVSYLQQLYVGLSRARNHCVIVAPPAA
jgi:superfamily I DNA/RNA helicase